MLLKTLGLYSFVRDFGRVYERGARGRGLRTGLKNKKAFQNKLTAVLIEIHFEFTRFFSLQDVVKYYFISIQAGGGGGGGGRAYIPVVFLFTGPGCSNQG